MKKSSIICFFVVSCTSATVGSRKVENRCESFFGKVVQAHTKDCWIADKYFVRRDYYLSYLCLCFARPTPDDFSAVALLAATPFGFFAGLLAGVGVFTCCFVSCCVSTLATACSSAIVYKDLNY